jgi:hypothetical protein
VTVFHHEVVVEEPDGLLRGGRRQPDEEGVEVVEDLSPEVVDGAVALVDDGEIEGLDGDALVVDDGQRFLGETRLELEERLFLGGFLELLFALEDRIEALDGRDDDLARGRGGSAPTYLADCDSTPISGCPFGLASMTPMAFPLT